MATPTFWYKPQNCSCDLLVFYASMHYIDTLHFYISMPTCMNNSKCKVCLLYHHNNPTFFSSFYLLDGISHETAAPSRSETNAAPHLQKTSPLFALLLVTLAAIFTL